MAANRQLARHAIPKNQNAFDEEVTKSTVKCYHSPARTREQESWKEEKNTRERGSRDQIRTRSIAQKKLTLVISPQERLRSCLSTYYVSPLLIGHIWRSGASAAFSHVFYEAGNWLSSSSNAPCLAPSTNSLLFAVFAGSQGYNIQPALACPRQEQAHNFRRSPSVFEELSYHRASRCVFVTLPSFSSLPARNSQVGPGRSLLSLLRRLTASGAERCIALFCATGHLIHFPRTGIARDDLCEFGQVPA